MGDVVTDDRDDLMRRIDELTRKVEALQARLAPADASTGPATAASTTGSRRDLLRLAGTAAAGAVAGTMLASSQPAAAATGDALVTGYSQLADRRTYLAYGGAGIAQGPLLTTEATMMWIDNRNSPNSFGHGVRGDGKGVGGFGLWGNNDFGGIGVFGGGGIGLAGSGTKAALQLQGTGTAPPTRSDAHVRGEIDIDTNGNVWLCVVAGTPGVWRRLGGPASAGAFHAISPVRAYDSRWTGGTRIAAGEGRLLSMADGHDVNTGAVNAAGAVPAGSTAVSYNLTITGTLSGGFLALAPGTATGITASSINWSGDGISIANGGIVALDGSRQVRVFAGGAGSTDFIIDITGYFI